MSSAEQPAAGTMAKPGARPGWRGTELPQLELDCMVVLWRTGGASAGDVRQALLARGRRLAYTSVLTVLQRLLRKGVVEAERGARAHVFRPRISREEMRQGAVQRLLKNYFDSAEELQLFLSRLRGAEADAAAHEESAAVDAILL